MIDLKQVETYFPEYNFIDNFKCPQCGKKPYYNNNGALLCLCKRTSKTEISMAHALIFNASQQYVWALIMPKDKKDPILFYLYKKNNDQEHWYHWSENNFMWGNQSLAIIIADTPNHLMHVEEIPDFIKKNWNDMVETILMLDVFK